MRKHKQFIGERYKLNELVRIQKEPKAIAYYRSQGFNMIPCKKYAGSRLANTKKLKRFKHIYCSDKCVPVVRELKNLTYKVNKRGEIVEDEFNIDPHTLSAIWYGLDGYEVADLKQFDRDEYGI